MSRPLRSTTVYFGDSAGGSPSPFRHGWARQAGGQRPLASAPSRAGLRKALGTIRSEQSAHCPGLIEILVSVQYVCAHLLCAPFCVSPVRFQLSTTATSLSQIRPVSFVRGYRDARGGRTRDFDRCPFSRVRFDEATSITRITATVRKLDFPPPPAGERAAAAGRPRSDRTRAAPALRPEFAILRPTFDRVILACSLTIDRRMGQKGGQKGSRILP